MSMALDSGKRGHRRQGDVGQNTERWGTSGLRSPASRATVELGKLQLRRAELGGEGSEWLESLAYECWQSVWSETFKELVGIASLPSDEFTRQHEVSVLLQGGECLALFLARQVDWSRPAARADSYFSVWPKAAQAAACAEGTRLYIPGNFAIPPQWRRPQNCALSLLMCALVVESFLATRCDALVATMRVDRRMNELAYAVGAKPLCRGLTRYGVPVDLVVFHRATCSRPKLDEETERLVQRLRPGKPCAAMAEGPDGSRWEH